MGFSLETIVLWVVPVVFAITLHEAAHGYVAKLFGDRTAEMLGRITLNPLKHIDPVGTLLVPGVLLALAWINKSPPFVFGWAKPVPVNFGNLRNPKRDMIWVAAAGPGSNFLQALLWALLLVAVAPGSVWTSEGLFEMADIGFKVNLVLMALNLLPLPPLDGGRVLAGLLPHGAASALARVEPYGLFIILALLATGVLDDLMRPMMRIAASAIGRIVGII
ncbi:MAG: site-2 protease family protein [Betaproteobacteria bacterium]